MRFSTSVLDVLPMHDETNPGREKQLTTLLHEAGDDEQDAHAAHPSREAKSHSEQSPEAEGHPPGCRPRRNPA